MAKKPPANTTRIDRDETDDISQPILFTYFDGNRVRHGDAAALFRKVEYFDGVPLTEPEFWQQVDDRAEPATSKAIEAIASIFGINRHDDATGKGLTDDQVADVYAKFLSLLFVQKKTADGGLIVPRRFLLRWAARANGSTAAGDGSGSCSTVTASTTPGHSPSPISSPTHSARRSAKSGTKRRSARPKPRQ